MPQVVLASRRTEIAISQTHLARPLDVYHETVFADRASLDVPEPPFSFLLSQRRYSSALPRPLPAGLGGA